MKEELKKKIEQVISLLLEESQLDLVGIKMDRHGRRHMITVFADRCTGGITIDECAAANKRIAARIEEENLIEDDYVIEVSSPGVDWPLRTKNDYSRAIHKKVRFLLEEAINDKQEYIGTISRVDEGQVVIICPPSEEVVIPMEKIKKAVQVI